MPNTCLHTKTHVLEDEKQLGAQTHTLTEPTLQEARIVVRQGASFVHDTI